MQIKNTLEPSGVAPMVEMFDKIGLGQWFRYRHYEPTIPPAVTYGLTKRMQEISGALDKLDELAHKWQEEDAKAARKRKAQAV